MRTIPRLVWAYALAITLITSLPYIIAAVTAPEGYTYTGAASQPAGIAVDYFSHLAKMQQGQRGDWDYHLLFTSEEHPGAPLVQAFYVALGWASAFDLPLTYHITRAALTFGLILMLWVFGSRFFPRPGDRWVFLLFSTLVTGMSWLLLIVDPAQTAQVAPIEFWLIDAYHLSGALFMPHFSAAIILQLLAVLLFFNRQVIALTIALALLTLVQPYIILLTVPLFGLLLMRDFVGGRIKIAGLIPFVLPFAVQATLTLYLYNATQSDPIWQSFTAQNITSSPPPLYYLLGYLPFLIPIALLVRPQQILAALMPVKQSNAATNSARVLLLFIVWILIVAVLLYAPIPTQRRYLIGIQTPLAALAAVGWVTLMRRLPERVRPLITLAYVGIAAAPLAFLILSNIASRPVDLYLSPAETAGYAWIERETAVDDVILTTFDWSGRGSGGKLAAFTGRRVFIGHWIETAYFDDKLVRVQRFYNPGSTDAERCEFLSEYGIDYVWYDDYARSIGTLDPEAVPCLQRVIASENDAIIIYRVIDGL